MKNPFSPSGSLFKPVAAFCRSWVAASELVVIFVAGGLVPCSRLLSKIRYFGDLPKQYIVLDGMKIKKQM